MYLMAYIGNHKVVLSETSMFRALIYGMGTKFVKLYQWVKIALPGVLGILETDQIYIPKQYVLLIGAAT